LSFGVAAACARPQPATAQKALEYRDAAQNDSTERVYSHCCTAQGALLAALIWSLAEQNLF
jgi:hypothetical protein